MNGRGFTFNIEQEPALLYIDCGHLESGLMATVFIVSRVCSSRDWFYINQIHYIVDGVKSRLGKKLSQQ